MKKIMLLMLALALTFLVARLPVSIAEDAAKGLEGMTPLKIMPKMGKKPVTIETQTLDEVGKKIGGKIDHIGDDILSKTPSGLSGWLNSKAYGRLTWLKLLVCLCLLTGVFVGERRLQRWIGSMLRRAGNGEATTPLSGSSINTFRRPITLFIWVYGSYAALSPLFEHFQHTDGSNPLQAAMKKGAEAGGVVAIIWFAYALVSLFDEQLRRRMPPGQSFPRSLVSHCRAPFRFFVTLALARMALPLFEGFPHLFSMLVNLLSILLIASIAWFLIQATLVLEDLIFSHYRVDLKDNLMARRVRTQVRFLRKVIVVVVVVVAAASALMLFEKVRQLGASILTSAGILGVVVGLAAQRSIANLLVGLQIAITQPMRIDDVVIVENEWGRIEEITSTYVAIRLWDLRRLIAPLTYFTEKPFQNWTRTSAEILGTVYLYTDYTIPVEAVRKELLRVLKESELWDGKVWGLQVTNATENAVELRALMSAADASMAWDLRCEVREKLIAFIRSAFPQSLPRKRAEIAPGRSGSMGSETPGGDGRGRENQPPAPFL